VEALATTEAAADAEPTNKGSFLDRNQSLFEYVRAALAAALLFRACYTLAALFA